MIAQNIRQQPRTLKIILAENQPEYEPLPALQDPVAGTFLTEWAFTEEERKIIAAGGVLRMWVWGRQFQPIALMILPAAEKLELEPVQ